MIFLTRQSCSKALALPNLSNFFREAITYQNLYQNITENFLTLNKLMFNAKKGYLSLKTLKL